MKHTLAMLARSLARRLQSIYRADPAAAVALPCTALTASATKPQSSAPAAWSPSAPTAALANASIGSVQASQHQRLVLAASNGFANAQQALALAYDDGEHVQRDPTTAVKWYFAAAKAGHPAAQTALAARFEYGLDLPRNPHEAAKWWARAAEAGVEMARQHVAASAAAAAATMAAEPEWPQAWQRPHSVNIVPTAATATAATSPASAAVAGDPDAQLAMAATEAEQAAAVGWEFRAARGGSAMAMTALGKRFHFGDGVPVEAAVAAEWYRKAGEAGDGSARQHLVMLRTTASEASGARAAFRAGRDGRPLAPTVKSHRLAALRPRAAAAHPRGPAAGAPPGQHSHDTSRVSHG